MEPKKGLHGGASVCPHPGGQGKGSVRAKSSEFGDKQREDMSLLAVGSNSFLGRVVRMLEMASRARGSAWSITQNSLGSNPV